MKLFDVNWVAVLDNIPRFTALALPARRILLDALKPSGYVQSHRFGAQLEEIVASGIPEYDPARNRLWLGDEQRGLVKVLRAMNRHPVFDIASAERGRAADPVLISYMEEHFSSAEIQAIGSKGASGRRFMESKHTLAPRVAFAGWAGDLLNAESDELLLAWAVNRGRSVDLLDTGDALTILRGLQAFARALLAFPDGVPLRNVTAPLARKDVPAFADALYTGLETLVVFAGMRRDDLEPMVGLWPAAARELSRPKASAPTAVPVVETFSLAVHMEDMTTVLAAVVAAPIRLRASDGAVFARTRTDIEPRLVTFPSWTETWLAHPHVNRVDAAARRLESYGFVAHEMHDTNLHLGATVAGSRWLALSPHGRLAALVTPLRKSKEVNPATAYEAVGATRFFPFTLPYYRVPASLRLRESLTKTLLGADSGFVPVQEFVAHAALESNPFLGLSDVDVNSLLYFNGGDERETFRDLWTQMLMQFLATRLVSLGGASLGLHENGGICFSLTDVGRYLLGVCDDFEYGTAESADVVIQPNFDVVFLGAAPATEAAIARFAQRVGAAPGLAFRITRASVLTAAETGATAGDIVGVLIAASTKGVPKNVQREIAGWVGAVRRATVRRVELLECADVEAAARVAELLGERGRRLAPLVFELPPSTASVRAALVKRLRAGGVFLQDATARAAPPKAGRRDRFEEEWEDE